MKGLLISAFSTASLFMGASTITITPANAVFAASLHQLQQLFLLPL